MVAVDGSVDTTVDGDPSDGDCEEMAELSGGAMVN